MRRRRPLAASAESGQQPVTHGAEEGSKAAASSRSMRGNIVLVRMRERERENERTREYTGITYLKTVVKKAE